jgi:hypothetical protein
MDEDFRMPVPPAPPAPPAPPSPPSPPEPPKFSIGLFLGGICAGTAAGGIGGGMVFFACAGIADVLHVKGGAFLAALMVGVTALFLGWALFRTTRRQAGSMERGLLAGAAFGMLLWSTCAVLVANFRFAG